MAAVAHPSSSSSFDNYDYNVFLSFRGEDTRGNFTDHLYTALVRAGIRTFRDNEELNHGEEIGPRLMKTIQESKISIPIFSKNYASSKWCLQELTKMMECNKTCGQIVWPIFYKVDPSHVRNQTGCFEEAFLKHKREQGEEKVMTWRKSLNDVGNLKGWDSEDSEYRYETNLINSVVERALSELIQITTLQVAKHPIGIDSHVEEVMRMLDIKSGGVQFVGIHGMGGIGKTTMAKAVFNKISSQFESCSFLDDVRERSCEGLVKLQNKLVSDSSKGRNGGIKMVDRGINVIKETFSNKKVLIILDDVDQDRQLDALAGGRDWFGLGSRIIITTRDEHILNVDQVEKSKIYKPDVLDHNLSLQLFSKHAFGRDQPPQDFRELSKRVVFIAGGLPLSLELLGSFLRDKRRDTEWESTLKMLKKFPNDQVQKKLQISYDGLNSFCKDIFLDIACFFIDVDEENVIPAWEDSDDCPRVAIKVLVHKSLVKIDNDNKLRMHDQLRDMGREIVRQENQKKPGKRSRLWSHEEALDVLKKHKGSRNVEGLFLDFSYQAKNRWIEPIVKLPEIDPADLLTKAFEKMSDLRLLQVDHAYHDKNNFGHLPQGLKWLSLKGISCKCVPTISHLEKLVVLDLSESMITDDWNGWQQIQLIRTLKVLDLSRCYWLESTPHFSCDTSLERLILNDCTKLVAVHESIGHLKKLVFLSLNQCIELTELPDSISKLSSIKSLILSWCKNLEKLPKELGNMESLTELIIDRTRIEEIPDSIGLLEKLERLSVSGCVKLTELPDSICKLSSIRSLILSYCHKLEKLPKELGNMESLTELIIDETIIEEIPDSIGLLEKVERLSALYCANLTELPDNIAKLSSIKSLILSWCKNLEKLPKELGNMESLTELIIDKTRIEEIPDSIGLLEKLETLTASGCVKLTELPDSICKLSSIRSLILSYCHKLKKLPKELGNMESLTELIIDRTRIEEIPDSIGLLEKLETLSASGCHNLTELPDSTCKLSSIKSLILTECINLERLPKELGNMESLTELIIDKTRIEEIPNSIGLLEKLETLSARGCHNLTELPDSICKLSSIRSLILSYCHKLEKLPKELGNMESLTELIIDRTRIEEIPDSIGLLEKLERLSARYCENLTELPDSISKLSSIKSLILSGCKNLEKLPKELGNMESLTELIIDHTTIEEIPDSIALLEKLERLSASYCENLTELPDSICKLSSIKSLILSHCLKLEKLPKELGNMESLTELFIDFTRIEEMPDSIGLLEKLETLSTRGCQDLRELPDSICKLSSTKSLNFSYCHMLEKLPKELGNMESLTELIIDFTRIEEIPDSIGLLEKLERLSASPCLELKKLPNLSNLKSLRALCLFDCKKLFEIQGISGLSLLQQLDLKKCTTLKLLPELPPGLIKLDIGDCTSMERLPNLSTLKILKELHLEHCSKLAEIEGIDELTLLQELDLTNCKNLQSLPELPSSLIKLIATDCSSIERLTNLSNLKNLQALRLHGCEKLSEIQGISGLSLLQKLDLTCCITLQSLPELPPSLIRLDIPCCESMERLPNVSTLKNLEGLCLWGCGQLTKIEGIDGLTLLQELDFTNCKNLQSLPELPSSLIKLNARNCSSIERLPNLSNLKNLRELLLCGCMTLSQIQGINDLTLLQQLDLKHCIRLQSLPELPPSLIRLDVSSCISMKRLPNLPTMKSLQELPSGLTKVDARYCGSIETLPNLSNLKSLQELYLCCSNPSEIQDISGLSLLQELDLKDCKMLQYLPGLPPSLIRLDIEGCISMERSPNLSSLRSLKVLHINNCMNLANIQGINDLTLLQELYLQGCSKLQSLSELPSNLITLHLRDCYNLVEIRGLESLESLINFKVCGCPTYIKSVQKTVSQGTLPTTVFKEGEICNKYYLIPDDDNIKGTIFYFVYQFLRDPASPSLIRADDFTIEAKIWKYDSNKTIKCFHEIRIEGLRANTKKDQLFYSCYFQGLTWFGFPLKKRDIFHVTNASFQFSDAQVKMLDLDIEYEAMEDSQQLEKRVIPLITSTTKKGKKNMMPNLEIGNIAYLLG